MFIFESKTKMKKYRVKLTAAEKADAKQNIESGKSSKTKLKRAQILLGSDESDGGKNMTDEEISKAYDVSLRTIERTRQRCVESGYELAIKGKPRPLNARIKIDGDAEAYLVATSCSEAPEGYEKWTLELLAQELKKNGYVMSISREAIRQTLKKTKRNHGRKNIS